TQLTVASAWTTTPDSSSCYVIIREPIISTTVATNDTITFDRLIDSGYSSDHPTTSNNILNDATLSSGGTVTYTGKSWSASSFNSTSNTSYTVKIIAGTGAGQTCTISSNTSNQLTVSTCSTSSQTSTAWITVPDTSSFYVITRK